MENDLEGRLRKGFQGLYQIKESEYVEPLATVEYLAKRFRETFFIPSHIRFDPDLDKFKSKYPEELHHKVCRRVNNDFEYFKQGFKEAELIVRMEGEDEL